MIHLVAMALMLLLMTSTIALGLFQHGHAYPSKRRIHAGPPIAAVIVEFAILYIGGFWHL